MATTIIDQITDDTQIPASHEFVARARNGAIIATDTRTELIETLFPGYAEMNDADAFLWRHDYLDSLIPPLRASLFSRANTAPEEGGRPEDIEALSEDELNTYLNEDSNVIEGDWTANLPIFALATHYAPVTGMPRPEGNIIWLDPTDETTFLDALATAGLIRLMTREVDDVAHED